MKHIFYIHSYITYLVSVKIIETENLLKKDCIFLINRKVIIQDDVVSYAIDHFCSSEAVPITSNIIGGWQSLKNIDAFIDAITSKEKFYLYLPNTRGRFIGILTTHKKCLGYHFIEEGLASYFRQEQANMNIAVRSFSLKERVNKYLCYGNRLSNLHFYNSNYKNVYGLSVHSFPGFRNRVILKDYVANNKEKEGIYDNAHIIVFDALVEFKIVTYESFIESLRKLIAYFIENSIRVVHYKLHPEQLKVNGCGKSIKEILESVDVVKFLQIPEDTILELVILNNSSLTFYIVVSSVGLYAAFYGHSVYSYMDNLKQGNERFKGLIEDLPNVFLKVIKQIQL